MPETEEDMYPHYLVSLNRQVSKCRYCGSEIRWGTTRKGKNICMEVYPDDAIGEHGEFVAHKANCEGPV